MSAPALQGDPGRSEFHSGRREGVASLLMLVVEATLFVPLILVGSALHSALDLDGDELLVEAGAWGWVAALAMVALLVIAPVAGVVLGARARRLGERRLGTVSAVANAVLGAYLVLASVVQMIAA